MLPPNFFSKKPLPEKLPEGMQKIVEQLKKCKTKEECLKKAYDVVTKKYRGYFLRTYLRVWEFFRCDIDQLWDTKDDFIHCNNVNYVLRTLLVKSGKFKEEDILPKNTLVVISPHQYLRIRLGKDRFIDVDSWGRAHGIGLGDYGHGFHMTGHEK
jgi:hypothetical protein